MAIIKVRNPAIDLDAAEIPNLDAAKITSGTFADARIASSNVSQHVTAFDDNKLVNDISTLALRQASNENKAAYNTNSMYVDVFQDSTGITNLTNTVRNDSEYLSAISSSSSSSFTIGSSNFSTYIDTVNTRQNGASEVLDTNFSSGDEMTVVEDTSTYTVSQLGLYMFDPNASGNINSNIWQDGSGTHNHNYSAGANGDGSWFFHLNKGSYTGFTPTGVSLKWRNGAGSVNNIKLYGLASAGATATLLGTIFSGTLSHGPARSITFSNTTSFPTLMVVANMSGNNYHGFDNLEFTGTAEQQTVNATGSFESNAITAPSSTSSMGAIITYQDNAGTNTLNTDIVLKLSANGGSNYSTATLTAMPDFATGIKMAKVNDLSVTAGTSLKYKLEFANQASGSKEARIRGVSLQY